MTTTDGEPVGEVVENIVRSVFDDLEIYRRKDGDAFWSDRKRAWYRRFAANVERCRAELEPSLLDIIDDILSREKPPGPVKLFQSSQYSDVMETPGPRD